MTDASARVRDLTSAVLRHIDQELEETRRATARRIVWTSLLAGWDDPADLLRADRWVAGDEYEDGEVVLTLIDEIRAGYPPE
jgi:hypothetical protein